MKVLLRRNIAKLGQIGDVVEVRPGYARNYLLPEGLATVPTEANMRAIETEKKAYLEELAKQRAELEARALVLAGKEFTITARANEEGHLYGSIGPAQIAAAIGQEGIFIEPDNIVLDEPMRKLDKYEVVVQFGDDVRATIGVWVVPPREDEQPADAAEVEAAGEVGDVPAPAGAEDATPEQEAPQQ